MTHNPKLDAETKLWDKETRLKLSSGEWTGITGLGNNVVTVLMRPSFCLRSVSTDSGIGFETIKAPEHIRRIYIAGPMSKLDDHNFPMFDAAHTALRMLGHIVVNPADLTRILHDGVTTLPPHIYLREDIKALLTCQAICLLPGWENSSGAKLEAATALTLRLPFFFYQKAEGALPFTPPEQILITDGYKHDPRLLDV